LRKFLHIMKKLLYTIAAALLLCACGSKPEQKQCPYIEEEFVIHGSVLQSPGYFLTFGCLKKKILFAHTVFQPHL